MVRLHRAGEGAPYTGLKPAGLDVGPVIPLAEKAIQQGSAEQLGDFLAAVLKGQLERRLEEVRNLEPQHLPSVGAARRYVQAMLGFQVYSHHVYQAMLASGHHEGTVHAAHHG